MVLTLAHPLGLETQINASLISHLSSEKLVFIKMLVTKRTTTGQGSES